MADPYIMKEVDPAVDLESFADIIRLHQVLFPYDMMEVPDGGYWWTIKHDDVPVAFAGMRSYVPLNKIGYLCRAGVMRTHRGNGLQVRLINARIEKAKALHLTSVISTTFDNPRSSNNLIACGFRMYEPKKRNCAEGACYWKLILPREKNVSIK